ncbi:MAG: ABC-2 transporter permease [Lachnospiraceae bacterium]|nr:ABC-2 transporter permease [Lachnospiraceae bacterium]
MDTILALTKKNFLISKKITIAGLCVCLLFLGEFTALFVSLDAAEKSAALIMNPGINTTMPVFLSFMVLYFMIMPGVDPVHKSDISSRWLSYSYTMPVTTLARCASIFLFRLIKLLFGFLVCLGIFTASDLFWGDPVTVKNLAYLPVFASFLVFLSFPGDLFALRSRNMIEYQKLNRLSQATMTVQLLISLFIFLKISGISIMSILNSETNSSLSIPELGTNALLVSSLLFVFTELISFLILYCSLKKPYNAMTVKRRMKNHIQEHTVIIKKHSPRGLLYLDLSQNKTVLIFIAVIPFLCMLLPFLVMTGRSLSEKPPVSALFMFAASPAAFIGSYLTGFISLNILLSAFFTNDSKKLWAYFVSSCPGGAEAYVKKRYITILFVNALFHILFLVAGKLLSFISLRVTGIETYDPWRIYFLGAFLTMFFNGTDFPLIFRFGAKRASIIRLSIVIALLILLTVIFSLLGDDAKESIFKLFDDITHIRLNAALQAAMYVIPLVSVIKYYLSAKLSGKLYISGAENSH